MSTPTRQTSSTPKRRNMLAHLRMRREILSPAQSLSKSISEGIKSFRWETNLAWGGSRVVSIACGVINGSARTSTCTSFQASVGFRHSRESGNRVQIRTHATLGRNDAAFLPAYNLAGSVFRQTQGAESNSSTVQ